MTLVSTKAKFLLIISLIFFVTAVPTLAIAEEDTGSIIVDLKYQTGDRLDTYQTVLKIFQDYDENPYVIVEFPKANPILIDSLPLGHEYKVEVYVTGMLSGTTNIDVDGDKEITMLIPTQGGIKFLVLYDDSYTPIEGATVSIKSNDGYLWREDIVGDEGYTQRFWMQSNNLIDNYYIVEVLVDQSISYVSPEHIKFSPNVQSEIKITTPWPKTIDDQITVSVYKDEFNKVTLSDGSFVVELYDNKNNKVTQSSVTNKGDAFFSNIKVGQYAFKVIKQPSDSESNAELYAVINTILTGKESSIIIFEQGYANQSLQETCNCVAFRLDDIQDYYLSIPQIEVMKLFQQKNAPLTLGIIGGFWGEDQNMLNYIKADQNRPTPTFEIGSHSWNNSPLPNFDKNDQLTLLQKTNDIIQDTLGVTPTTFTAVENLFNDDTLTVLQELGFTHFTAHIDETHTPPYALENSTLYYFPASTQTAILNLETNIWDTVENEVTYTEANDFLREHGFAVIMMHPYEFAETDFGVFTDNYSSQSIDNLGKLIDQFRDNGINLVSIGQITEKNILGDEDTESSQKDSAAKCNQPLAPFIDLSGCNFKGQSIQDIDLGNSNLTRIDLSSTTIKYANFANSTLLEADIRGAYTSSVDFSNADFSGVNLSNAKLEETNLRGVDFSGGTLKNMIFLNLDARGVNFTGADMSGSIFKGAGFSNTDLTGVILNDVDLSGINLAEAVLKDVSLKNADLTGTSFLNAELVGSKLNGADLTNANLHGTNLSGVDLTGAILKDVTFSNANMSKVNLSGVDLTGINLSNAILSGANLANTDLSQVILKGSNLSNANLKDTNLSGVDLTGTILNGADLTNANLNGANLSGVDLTGTILKDVTFSNANMNRVNLSGADLTGINLSNAILSGSDLSNADLKVTDFSGAVLDGVNLANTDMKGADFSGAVLDGVNLANTDMKGADFSGAVLDGANLENADLNGADFSGANLSNVEINLKDLDSAKTDSETKLPERGFFFFRELFAFFESLFGWS